MFPEMDSIDVRIVDHAQLQEPIESPENEYGIRLLF